MWANYVDFKKTFRLYFKHHLKPIPYRRKNYLNLTNKQSSCSEIQLYIADKFMDIIPLEVSITCENNIAKGYYDGSSYCRTTILRLEH